MWQERGLNGHMHRHRPSGLRQLLPRMPALANRPSSNMCSNVSGAVHCQKTPGSVKVLSFIMHCPDDNCMSTEPRAATATDLAVGARMHCGARPNAIHLPSSAIDTTGLGLFRSAHSSCRAYRKRSESTILQTGTGATGVGPEPTESNGSQHRNNLKQMCNILQALLFLCRCCARSKGSLGLQHPAPNPPAHARSSDAAQALPPRPPQLTRNNDFKPMCVNCQIMLYMHVYIQYTCNQELPHTICNNSRNVMLFASRLWFQAK